MNEKTINKHPLALVPRSVQLREWHVKYLHGLCSEWNVGFNIALERVLDEALQEYNDYSCHAWQQGEESHGWNTWSNTTN